MIQIRQQCWDRAAAELGSKLTADKAAKALRKKGLSVEIINGDWGSSYLADSPEEHDAVAALA